MHDTTDQMAVKVKKGNYYYESNLEKIGSEAI